MTGLTPICPDPATGQLNHNLKRLRKMRLLIAFITNVLSAFCILACAGFSCNILGQTNDNSLVKVDNDQRCGRDPIATAKTENIWIVQNHTNAEYTWTFCDGSVLREWKYDYDSETNFEKFMKKANIEGQLRDKSPIRDRSKKEVGTSWLFRVVTMEEKYWLIILRVGTRTDKLQSSSFIHVQYSANVRMEALADESH